MRILRGTIVLISFLTIVLSFTTKVVEGNKHIYIVKKLTGSIKIDANWNKSQWKSIEPIDITNCMGEIPSFRPVALAKMVYDDNNIFIVFKVVDKYVRSLAKDINGPVWEDSCVEFFFAPDNGFPMRYFNLEINCGGTPLMHYNLVPRKEFNNLAIEDIQKIEIAHSMPQIVDPEIVEQVSWTIECRIPINILIKYSKITQPKPGVEWKGNFYKIAEKTSNPHYLTWAVINNKNPDFHLPQFFGILKFE